MAKEKLTIFEKETNGRIQIPVANTFDQDLLPISNKVKDLMLLVMCMIGLCIIIGESFQYFRERAHRRRSH